MKQYLFMCGTPRSGTTYLANLIGAHPSIVLGVERFKFHYSRQTLVPELFEKERFFDLRGSDTSLRLQVALPDSGRMQEKFDGARYVGDKYPNLIKQLGLVLSRFPGATILFVLRDPLSVGLSWGARARNPKDHWPATNDCIAGIRFWMDAVRAAAAARAAGARIIAMDYERRTPSAGDVASDGSSVATGAARTLVRNPAAWCVQPQLHGRRTCRCPGSLGVSGLGCVRFCVCGRWHDAAGVGVGNNALGRGRG